MALAFTLCGCPLCDQAFMLTITDEAIVAVRKNLVIVFISKNVKIMVVY